MLKARMTAAAVLFKYILIPGGIGVVLAMWATLLMGMLFPKAVAATGIIFFLTLLSGWPIWWYFSHWIGHRKRDE